MNARPAGWWMASTLETMSSTIRLALIALCAVVLRATPSLAQAPGYVRVKFVKAGLMVGAGGGSGGLTYRGRDYPLRVSGLRPGWYARRRRDVSRSGLSVQSIRSQPWVLRLEHRSAGWRDGLQVSGRSATSPAATA